METISIEYVTTELASPLGRITLVSDGSALAGAYLETQPHPALATSARHGHDRVLARACDQLAGYFAGERWTFDLPLAPRGTELQREVWSALCEIPFGETISYATLARRIGRPSAARAVGAANGKNPLSIIVPCHRVVGSNGALVGYAGGLPAKEWLLRHERERASRIAVLTA